MKQVYGIWLPENDTHFERMMNADGTYQRDTFDYCMEYVKNPKIFYDIGAHVGLWSRMAINAGFKHIEAFEPNPKTYHCLRQNFEEWRIKSNIALFSWPTGVASYYGSMDVVKNMDGNSGAVQLVGGSHQGKNSIQVGPLEREPRFLISEYNIKPHETLVKIDTEGMEADCVLGMDKILYALRPVVCVEQRSNKDALEVLQQMGMEIVKIVRKDYILTWAI